MKDRNLWMKKEEKRTAPGLKRALKAVLGHKIVRLAGIAGVSLLFSASAAQTVLADDAGVWQPVENGYYLVGMDGSYLTGWQQMGGKWYLLGADGLMKTGWEQENGTWYYLQGDGAMATGWQNIDGKYYFLKDSGAMEGTTFTKDETQYTINADGSLANAKKKKNTGGGAYTLAFLDADTQAMADSLNELKADAFDGDEEEDYYDDDKKDYDKDASFILKENYSRSPNTVWRWHAVRAMEAAGSRMKAHLMITSNPSGKALRDVIRRFTSSTVMM